MPIRTAHAEWNGDLPSGSGTLSTENGSVEGSYSFSSRFEEGAGTNPEELLAAAHAACYSMALSHGLSEAGHTPESVSTRARVHLEKTDDGFSITRIELDCQARVPGIDEEAFRARAEDAKVGCPVSKALAGPEISLDARLAE